MEILVTYDIETTSKEGEKRLRKVAKVCETYGFRVQNSVFECKVDASEMMVFRHRLEAAIDATVDQVAMYRLREPFDAYVVKLGNKPDFGPKDALVI